MTSRQLRCRPSYTRGSDEAQEHMLPSYAFIPFQTFCVTFRASHTPVRTDVSSESPKQPFCGSLVIPAMEHPQYRSIHPWSKGLSGFRANYCWKRRTQWTCSGTLNRIAYSHDGEPISRLTVDVSLDTVLHNIVSLPTI